MSKLRPNSSRAKTAKTFMWVMAGAMAALMLTELYQAIVINDLLGKNAITYDDLERAQMADVYFFAVKGLQRILYILSIIFFIMWFRRAYFNLHQLKPIGLRLTEGWASGAWFVPVYNLWAPYNIASDLFTHTENILVENGLTVKKPERHQIKGYWWTFLIGSSVVTTVANQVIRNGDYDPDMILTGKYISIVAGALYVFCAFLAVRMIKQYSEMEELLPQLDNVNREVVVDDSDILDSGI